MLYLTEGISTGRGAQILRFYEVSALCTVYELPALGIYSPHEYFFALITDQDIWHWIVIVTHTVCVNVCLWQHCFLQVNRRLFIVVQRENLSIMKHTYAQRISNIS